MSHKHILTLICLLTLYQCAEIQANYTTHQVELQNTIKNHAKSINDKGTIAGQLETLDPSTGEKLFVDYFWNLDQPEPVVITTEGHEGHLPLINNHGQVAGIIKKKSTNWWEGDNWWQKDLREAYLYDPNEGLKLFGTPSEIGSGDMTIFGLTDEGEIHLHWHSSWFDLNWFTLIPKNNFYWFNYHSADYLQAWASNRKGTWLRSVNYESIFEKSAYLQVFNYWSGGYSLPGNAIMQGVAINDKDQVIAKNEDGTEGIFWPDSETRVELGDFIPLALNNNGDIVGKKEGSFYLRKADASMIDLSALLDEKPDTITGISDDGHMIGITKVHGQDKVIFLEPRIE